jgi:hypothetical protein
MTQDISEEEKRRILELREKGYQEYREKCTLRTFMNCTMSVVATRNMVWEKYETRMG